MFGAGNGAFEKLLVLSIGTGIVRHILSASTTRLGTVCTALLKFCTFVFEPDIYCMGYP
jgi:hypothetical protein